MKLALQRPPVMLEVGPVAGLDDMVGMKVSALQGRRVPRDLIDVFSFADRYGFAELERLGRRFDEDFRLDELNSHLELAMTLDEARFTEYGLDRETVGRLRRFYLAWYEDLSVRLAEQDHLGPRGG